MARFPRSSARADLALSGLVGTSEADKEKSLSLLEEAIALGGEATSDAASKKLFVTLSGHEPLKRGRAPSALPIAPAAYALSKYFAPAGAEATIEIAEYSPYSDDPAGAFNIGAAIREDAEKRCGLCDDMKMAISTHFSRQSDWSSIPRERDRLERALVVMGVTSDTLVPARYEKWLAVPTAAIRAAFERGEALVAVKERAGAPPLVTIAAPRAAQLGTALEKFAAMSTLPTAAPVAFKVPSALTKDEIRSTIRLRFGALKGCYESLLSRKPDAAGQLDVSMAVANTGKADTKVGLGSALEEPTYRACVEHALADMQFPAISNDPHDRTTVKYPIVVAP